MRRHLVILCLMVLASDWLLPGSAGAASVSEHLQFLGPLLGQEWVGHYTDEETAHFVHEVVWEPLLGGAAVRMTKRVDELDFVMETLYYWNAASSEVAYLSVTNRGQVSVGTAAALGDTIELLGRDLTGEGEVAYRYTLRVSGEDLLEDRFYRRAGGKWEERHFILYEGVRDSREAESGD